MTVSHMFIQDVPAMCVPDLDRVNRVNTFKPFLCKQNLRENSLLVSRFPMHVLTFCLLLCSLILILVPLICFYFLKVL